MLLRLKVVIIVLFLLGVGGWLAFFGWTNTWTLTTLARRGVVAEARVIDHAAGHYSRRSSSYSLTIEFTPAGRATLTKKLAVDGGDYHPAVESGRAQVRYLPDNPGVCAVGNPAVLPYQVIAVLGSGIFLAGLLVLWLVRRAAPRPACEGAAHPCHPSGLRS